ncbi:hypothetical protein JQ596_33605 [Bradyrhizobium manausense]|uniref:hypothetical protein n=1 Tax=Bradyrhizobium manausense TaxID=989370 RepID=UPI001BA851A1|nr:hypothetical protein [Bradyrhizobium manausense]MBR0830455.1 hypothetical protein [Bradyrhizobium manausense]
MRVAPRLHIRAIRPALYLAAIRHGTDYCVAKKRAIAGNPLASIRAIFAVQRAVHMVLKVSHCGVLTQSIKLWKQFAIVRKVFSTASNIDFDAFGRRFATQAGATITRPLHFKLTPLG